jgi:hypothetical protein
MLAADFGQGFALAHPMPPEILSHWLAGFTSRGRGASPRRARGALAAALRWEERFVELFDEPWSRERHVRAGVIGEYLREDGDAAGALLASQRGMLDAAARGPFDAEYGRRRDEFFSLLVERALAEEQAHGYRQPSAG